jgi:hypothetical protein
MNTQNKTYVELNEKLQGRNRNGRKIANNTYAERRCASVKWTAEDVTDEQACKVCHLSPNDPVTDADREVTAADFNSTNTTKPVAIAIRLHLTDILTFNPDGSVVANSGGWKTVTTKARLNDYLPSGYGISQSKGVWYWTQYNGQFETLGMFSDGDRILPDGKLEMQAKPSDEAKQAKLRKRINAYAKLCADALPLETPNAGDCFYCHMVTDEGKALGDAFNDTSHIELHMDEKYVVPSLVFHAMLERGWTTDKIPFAAAFGQADFMLDVAKREVRNAVNRYIFRRYGMVG